MQLRRWQSDCIKKAIQKYLAGLNHFLCLATPGAGKTLMASCLAQKLLQTGMVDLVVCFSPSVLVANDFQTSLELQTKSRMDGLLGSKGQSLTYQSMLHLDHSFWNLFDTHRIFVIFDEIHHCAGHSLENANAWGDKIIRHIQGRATYTLALSGTPWRSDKIPIALSSYCQNKKIHCDFTYGLRQAIQDKACRVPRITLIDNDKIVIHQDDQTQQFSSFNELLKNSDCSYQQLIENEELIVYLLKQSSKKLKHIRNSQPDAGGLIVAATVEHARKIAGLLRYHVGETAYMATYMEEDAQQIINSFRTNQEKWIISVGMISEGTNIPRLRVCCHLTRVKTELHFRQVLGRILRINVQDEGESFLYIPAEPSLVEYANRISEEIPNCTTINIDVMSGSIEKPNAPLNITNTLEHDSTQATLPQQTTIDVHFQPSTEIDITCGGTLEESYSSSINIFGRFKQELLSLNYL
jgi:superfamily II DNA or RNA helicase